MITQKKNLSNALYEPVSNSQQSSKWPCPQAITVPSQEINRKSPITKPRKTGKTKTKPRSLPEGIAQCLPIFHIKKGEKRTSKHSTNKPKSTSPNKKEEESWQIISNCFVNKPDFPRGPPQHGRGRKRGIFSGCGGKKPFPSWTLTIMQDLTRVHWRRSLSLSAVL